MSFVSSKGNILCRLIKIELYKIFAIINRAIKGLHCISIYIRPKAWPFWRQVMQRKLLILGVAFYTWSSSNNEALSDGSLLKCYLADTHWNILQMGTTKGIHACHSHNHIVYLNVSVIELTDFGNKSTIHTEKPSPDSGYVISSVWLHIIYPNISRSKEFYVPSIQCNNIKTMMYAAFFNPYFGFHS